MNIMHLSFFDCTLSDVNFFKSNLNSEKEKL